MGSNPTIATKFMNAKEARLKADEAKKIAQLRLEVEMNKIYDQIRLAANTAQNATTFDLMGSMLSNFVDRVIDTLKKDGYKVTHNQGNDIRDQDNGWNSLTISW